MFNPVPVSVCMPIYNGALYIRDAIQSVFNQTVIPQEIIVSDSDSSDGSENIVREEAQRSKVKVIILPTKTPGMVANWNSTIRAASGKYIKFLFQDDLLHSNCLEEMVKVAESDKRIGLVFSPRDLLVEPSVEEDLMTQWLLQHPNLSAAFGNLETNQAGSLLLRSSKLLQGPLNKIGEPTAVLVRTDLFHKVGLFNENMRQLVDMEMWVRLMASSHVGYIPRALSSVRFHAGQATNRHRTEEIDRFERDRLQDTLRTFAIYPLLHWRVKCALRFAQLRRNRLCVKKKRQPPVSAPEGGPDPLIPPDSLHSVGSHGSAEYVAVGEEFFRYFIDLCELKPDDRVLDVGSGTGRMARPLTRYLKGGSYEGIDIVARSVQWCQRTYASRYPNFRFHFADIYNKVYNPDGKHKASEYRLPFETSSFDFVFLTSVFTHMLPQDMEHYLSEVVRVLKPSNRCLITYFLINAAAWKLINEGASYHSFKYELPGCRTEFGDTPEAVVAYDESTVRGLYAKYRLNITEPVLYGTWCKRKDGLSWQDMIIATKPADCV